MGNVANCAQLANPSPPALGIVAWNCQGPAGQPLVHCSGELSLNTPWAKTATSKTSSLVFHLFYDVAQASTSRSVVTGVTGLWPKEEAFSNFGIVSNAAGNLTINIAYKGACVGEGTVRESVNQSTRSA